MDMINARIEKHVEGESLKASANGIRARRYSSVRDNAKAQWSICRAPQRRNRSRHTLAFAP